MHFHETPLRGAFVIDIDEKRDSRGFFARTFCAAEFEAHGLNAALVQCNLSFNHLRGTLRGMHFQTEPATEAKLVRCLRGAIHDVIIDMRPASPTYLEHFAVELTERNRRALFVPEMFAHGYQALTDEAEVSYQVSSFYAPDYERGLRHDDPHLGISWPIPVTSVSEKDMAWPLLSSRAPA